MEKLRDIAKLRRWCIRKRREGKPVSEICTATQTPRRTFYNWWNRYREHDPDGLKPQPKTPPTIHRTAPQLADEIKGVRVKTGWCPHKIAGYLRTQGHPVGHMTVYRTLRASGLNLEHARFQLHRKFIHYYNYERPHMSLNYSTPTEAYFESVPHILG